MIDHVSPTKRSQIMRSVGSKHTGPELIVRSAAHRLGLRFRLHPVGLPGRPDIVLPRWKTVIFVHGCYWHRHPGCPKATTPKSNERFWAAKFQRNVERDIENREDLEAMGWRVLTAWQCEVLAPVQAKTWLKSAFGPAGRSSANQARVHRADQPGGSTAPS